jgi:hypothetical protein
MRININLDGGKDRKGINMKKKMFLAGALVALMAVGAFAQTESDWSTKLEANGLTITLYKGKGGVVTVPARIGNQEIAVIGSNPFFNSMPVTSLTIPASVINLRVNAFNGLGSSLTSVTFQGKMVEGGIDPNAFIGLGDLRAKYLAGGAGTYTKSGSGNTAVWTKQGTAAQTSATQYAAESDFESVENVGSAMAIYGYRGTATVVTIPPRIRNLPVRLDSDAFAGNKNITSVILSEGVEVIGRSAFADCTSLTSITIPNSVEIIDTGAFSNCSRLTSITIPAGNLRQLSSNAFQGCTGLTSVTFQKPIPASGINANAFRGLGDLVDKWKAGGAGTYTRQANGTTWTKK